MAGSCPPPLPCIESQNAPHEALFFFWFQRGLAMGCDRRRQPEGVISVSKGRVSHTE